MTVDPIFKLVFGKDWDQLPPVFHKHYANRPGCDDHVVVEGYLNVSCAGPIRRLGWLFWLMGSIPPINEKNVPVTVHFTSEKNSARYRFERIFHFRNRPPYHFNSYMEQICDNKVIEITGGNMGWCTHFCWENNKIVMRHAGYVIRIMGYYIPVPLHWLIGRGYAEEIAVDDNTFDMCMHLTHPIWGKIYQYNGRFRMTKTP